MVTVEGYTSLAGPYALKLWAFCLCLSIARTQVVRLEMSVKTDHSTQRY